MQRQLKIFLSNIIFLLLTIVYILIPNNSSASDIFDLWTSISPISFDGGVASHYSFILKNKLYILGGANSTVPMSGSYAEIYSDGSLSPWNTIDSQVEMLWHSGITYDKYVYLLGGANASIKNVIDVVYGIVEPDGNILDWNTTKSLPFPLALGNAIVFDQNIYFAGGTTNYIDPSGANSEIYRAKINIDDGELDDWTLIGNLPEPMIGFGMVEINNYLYIIGGNSKINGILTNTRRAHINSDGSIGTWESMSQLPLPTMRAGITKINNLLVSVGGISTDDIYLDQVYYANINSDGTISEWQTSFNPLPKINCCSTLLTINNQLYLVGGHYGTPYGYYNEVFTTKLINSNPIYISLNVPNLKQYDGGWENDIYGNTNNTIGDFGCALTSASMILKFFGHDIDPGELNFWLKEQKDGFIRNGLVNWLAVSRYTKIHESGESPTLEYSRAKPGTEMILANLQNGFPTIVKVPGHFVVTKSQTETSYGINDPGYNDRNELYPQYPDNNIKSLSTFTPSHTDLSYMMFVGNDNLEFELFDSFGNKVDPTYTQDFIEDPIMELNGSIKSGKPLSILLFPKPTLGKYTLKVGSKIEGNFSFDTYLYDLDGNVFQKTFSIYFAPTYTYVYNIDFTENKDISLKNGGLYKSIIKKVYKINNDSRLFMNLIKQINNLTPKLLSEGFSLNILSMLKP